MDYQPLSLRWQQFYMNLAHGVATGSKDGSSKFGAILVRPDKTVASIGFNGFPRRIYDDPRYLTDPNMRPEKYKRVVHAEANCLDHNRDFDTRGYHMIVNGHPCDKCALRIVSTEVEFVYFCGNIDYETRWAESCRDSARIFEEAGVTLIRLAE
jgi:dCMP deaminase